jgi:hypothetical protein
MTARQGQGKKRMGDEDNIACRYNSMVRSGKTQAVVHM